MAAESRRKRVNSRESVRNGVIRGKKSQEKH